MAIRVLRIIEYVFKDEEIAAGHIDNMVVSFSVDNMKMKSTMLPFDSIEWEE